MLHIHIVHTYILCSIVSLTEILLQQICDDFYERCSTDLTKAAVVLSLLSTAFSYNSQPFHNGSPFAAQADFENSQTKLTKELVTIYEAQNVEFGFPSRSARRLAISNGHYHPDSPIPIDVDVYYPTDNTAEARIFLTIPRFGKGVPYSLAYLTNVAKANGTEIQPYPSYDWHSSHGMDCNGLTSIYRIQIDSCGQMWILDSGEIEFVRHCSPQMVVIDLSTDQLIYRYRLPPNMYKTNISRFVTPLVDISDPAPIGRCQKAFVYMADPTGVGIVVHDVENNKSWRIENKYTYPDPDFGTHTVAGESFELLDGAFGLAVTPPGIGLRRFLFFHALSNDAQIAIPLDIVNNFTNWGGGISSSLDKFVLLGKRNVQCGASAMTAHGFLLCGYLEPIGIFGWNIRTPYTSQNRVLLAENRLTLQFVSGLKVIKSPSGRDELWMVSNRLQRAFTGTINFNEINYRIQKCGVDELLKGKPCRQYIY